MSNILVPVDGSPGSSLALGAARELALATGAHMRLLRIVVPPPAYLSHAFVGHGHFYIDPRWGDDALLAAQTYVESVARHLASEGLNCAGVVRQGQSLLEDPVPEAIVGDAKEQDADVIVMSSDAHTGLARAVLGSVADGVVRAAPCPVLVLRRTRQAT